MLIDSKRNFYRQEVSESKREKMEPSHPSHTTAAAPAVAPAAVPVAAPAAAPTSTSAAPEMLSAPEAQLPALALTHQPAAAVNVPVYVLELDGTEYYLDEVHMVVNQTLFDMRRQYYALFEYHKMRFVYDEERAGDCIFAIGRGETRSAQVGYFRYQYVPVGPTSPHGLNFIASPARLVIIRNSSVAMVDGNRFKCFKRSRDGDGGGGSGGDAKKLKTLIEQKLRNIDISGLQNVNAACEQQRVHETKFARDVIVARETNMADLSDGATPLHDCARDGWPVAAYMLIMHGACPHRVDHTGRSPLYIALARGYTEVAALLREYCDENERDEMENRVLLTAATKIQSMIRRQQAKLILNVSAPSTSDDDDYET